LRPTLSEGAPLSDQTSLLLFSYEDTARFLVHRSWGAGKIPEMITIHEVVHWFGGGALLLFILGLVFSISFIAFAEEVKWLFREWPNKTIRELRYRCFPDCLWLTWKRDILTCERGDKKRAKFHSDFRFLFA
jgi:hypothetical protein